MEETVVIGAGPAGLTAAWRLGEGGVTVSIVEREQRVGGLCRSFRMNGCSFDIGPHLFKPRTDEVAALWDLLSEGDYSGDRASSAPLYFEGGLYDSNAEIVRSRPWLEVARMGSQLLRGVVRPRPVASAEDWLRNARGDAIYRVLYQPREEKFWGSPLTRIDSTWYASQTRGLRALLQGSLPRERRPGPPPRMPVRSGVRTTAGALRYPSHGSGPLYERLSEQAKGTQLRLGADLVRVLHEAGRVRAIVVRDTGTGEEQSLEGAHFISTIPLQVLIGRLDPPPDPAIAADAAKLFHRDLVVVNLVVEPQRSFDYRFVTILSRDVEVSRITNFAGLSSAMSDAHGRLPICMEYNAFEGDALWSREDAQLVELATRELGATGLAAPESVVAGEVRRVREACPVHVVDYRSIASRLIRYLDRFENLQSIGRNGLFTYNQMSHSVECGLRAAENLLGAQHAIAPPDSFDLRL